MPNEELAGTLDRESRLAFDVASSLDDGAFAGPTRLPLWNVKELFAHMWGDLDRIREYLGEPAPAEADADAVSYWRSYDAAREGVAIADRAKAVAGRFATGAELVASFEEARERSIALALATPAGRVVATRGPALRLDDYLETRILEMGVHGLDLAAAIGRDPWLTPEAAAVIRRILVGLLGEEPAIVRRWSDRSFIEAGTGRRGLTYEEHAALGPLAHAFPLLA
ncbi:MAG: maleylpyruvate isomerase family mycothiol-dependent enzyme [Actinomycetota bacterium]